MSVKATLQIAVVQPPMAWTTDENVAAVVAVLRAAAEQRATLCVFPGLALSGFHRGIRDQATPGIVAGVIEHVRSACREHAVACALGAPSLAPQDKFRNGYPVIDAAGEVVSTVSKNGLTPAGLTFFEAGTDRVVDRFAGRAFTTVMRREIDGLESISQQLREAPAELVFWPSIVGSPPATIHRKPEDTDDPGYLKRTATLAWRLAAFVVQINWPNALTRRNARIWARARSTPRTARSCSRCLATRPGSASSRSVSGASAESRSRPDDFSVETRWNATRSSSPPAH